MHSGCSWNEPNTEGLACKPGCQAPRPSTPMKGKGLSRLARIFRWREGRQQRAWVPLLSRPQKDTNSEKGTTPECPSFSKCTKKGEMKARDAGGKPERERQREREREREPHTHTHTHAHKRERERERQAERASDRVPLWVRLRGHADVAGQLLQEAWAPHPQSREVLTGATSLGRLGRQGSSRA